MISFGDLIVNFNWWSLIIVFLFLFLKLFFLSLLFIFVISILLRISYQLLVIFASIPRLIIMFIGLLSKYWSKQIYFKYFFELLSLYFQVLKFTILFRFYLIHSCFFILSIYLIFQLIFSILRLTLIALFSFFEFNQKIQQIFYQIFYFFQKISKK